MYTYAKKGPVLELMAQMGTLMPCLQSGHHIDFSHLVGVSGATKPLKGYYLQLRILSLALEEELKVLKPF